MGKKIVKLTFVEVEASSWNSIAETIYSFKWMKEHGLDNQKPVYISPDYNEQVYYINGWEIEDAKETKDKCVSGESERKETSTMGS
jgi:hypothetical protein